MGQAKRRKKLLGEIKNLSENSKKDLTAKLQTLCRNARINDEARADIMIPYEPRVNQYIWEVAQKFPDICLSGYLNEDERGRALVQVSAVKDALYTTVELFSEDFGKFCLWARPPGAFVQRSLSVYEDETFALSVAKDINDTIRKFDFFQWDDDGNPGYPFGFKEILEKMPGEDGKPRIFPCQIRIARH